MISDFRLGVFECGTGYRDEVRHRHLLRLNQCGKGDNK